MTDCIFCKIVNGEIPSYTIYEDDIVKAFLDLSQTTPGHTLVIPKQHIANIFDYDPELASAVFARIPKIARAIKASNPHIIGMNIINNNGEIAGQTIFHSHFHLVPRYGADDDFSIHFGDHSNQYTAAELAQTAANIKKYLED